MNEKEKIGVTPKHTAAALLNAIERTKKYYGESFLEKQPYKVEWTIRKGWAISYENDTLYYLGRLGRRNAYQIAMLMNSAYHAGMMDAATIMSIYGHDEKH